MNLRDAIKHSERASEGLTNEQKVAVLSLVTMARRVLRSRRALKQLMLAVSDEENLNQQEMFDKT